MIGARGVRGDLAVLVMFSLAITLGDCKDMILGRSVCLIKGVAPVDFPLP